MVDVSVSRSYFVEHASYCSNHCIVKFLVSTAASIKVSVFKAVVQFCLLMFHRRLCRHLGNVAKLPGYMAQYPRRQTS
jgi:hypothetical protein